MGYCSKIKTTPKKIQNGILIENNEAVIHQATQKFVYTEVNEVSYLNVEKPDQHQASINYENLTQLTHL